MPWMSMSLHWTRHCTGLLIIIHLIYCESLENCLITVVYNFEQLFINLDKKHPLRMFTNFTFFRSFDGSSAGNCCWACVCVEICCYFCIRKMRKRLFIFFCSRSSTFPQENPSRNVSHQFNHAALFFLLLSARAFSGNKQVDILHEFYEIHIYFGQWNSKRSITMNYSAY